jgi:hypothetical protein
MVALFVGPMGTATGPMACENACPVGNTPLSVAPTVALLGIDDETVSTVPSCPAGQGPGTITGTASPLVSAVTFRLALCSGGDSIHVDSTQASAETLGNETGPTVKLTVAASALPELKITRPAPNRPQILDVCRIGDFLKPGIAYLLYKWPEDDQVSTRKIAVDSRRLP